MIDITSIDCEIAAVRFAPDAMIMVVPHAVTNAVTVAVSRTTMMVWRIWGLLVKRTEQSPGFPRAHPSQSLVAAVRGRVQSSMKKFESKFTETFQRFTRACRAPRPMT